MKKIFHTLFIFFMFVGVFLLGISFIGGLIALLLWALGTFGPAAVGVTLVISLIVFAAAALTKDYLEHEKLYK